MEQDSNAYFDIDSNVELKLNASLKWAQNADKVMYGRNLIQEQATTHMVVLDCITHVDAFKPLTAVMTFVSKKQGVSYMLKTHYIKKTYDIVFIL